MNTFAKFYCKAFLFLALLVSAFPCFASGPFSSATVTQMTPLLGGLCNAYSPAFANGQKTMFLGGWRDATGTYGVGDDRLFLSTLTSSGWTAAAPLPWTNHPTPGVVPGYHANDPTVVSQTNGSLYMYYTAAQDNANMPGGVNSVPWLGFATSQNSGQTWTDDGPVLENNNGFNSNGEWSPSALVNATNGVVWVYYHTAGSPILILRSRFNSNGSTLMDTTQLTTASGTKMLTNLANVSVAQGTAANDVNYFWMVANAATPNATYWNEIVLYLSTDGVDFEPFDGAQGLLISGGPNEVVTPQIILPGGSSNSFSVAFGFGPGNSSCGSFSGAVSTSIQEWSFTLH